MKNQMEIERKYIIKMPKLEMLTRMPGFTESDILQIYMPNTPSGATHRARKRVYKGTGRVELTENMKQRVDGMSAMEWEAPITAAKFNELMNNKSKEHNPLMKTRYTFDYLGYVIEIDVYPQWKRSCIMEIEIGDTEEEAQIPSFIQIIKEVTGDKQYSNHSMSRSFPAEVI